MTMSQDMEPKSTVRVPKGKTERCGLIQGKRRYSSSISVRVCDAGPLVSEETFLSRPQRFAGMRRMDLKR